MCTFFSIHFTLPNLKKSSSIFYFFLAYETKCSKRILFMSFYRPESENMRNMDIYICSINKKGMVMYSPAVEFLSAFVIVRRVLLFCMKKKK